MERDRADSTSTGSHVELSLDFRSEPVHLWRRVPGAAGSRRSKHTIVAFSNELYVFGGDDGCLPAWLYLIPLRRHKMLNDMIKFDVAKEQWFKVTTGGQAPSPRYHHSAVIYNDSMLVFGGYSGDLFSNSNLENRNDIFEYRFDTAQWFEWTTVGSTRPVPRSAHGAVVWGDRLWIFAGYDGKARLNDMWTLSLTEPHEWQEVEQLGQRPPTCCNFPVAVARDQMYVFSGHSGANTTNHLFCFHFRTRRWERILARHHILHGGVPPPPRRFGHTMVFYDRHLYVFGGAADNTLPNDLFVFDLDSSTWHTAEPKSEGQVPSGRCFHSAAVVGSALYVFGGTTDFSQNVKSADLYRFQFSAFPKCTLEEDFAAFLARGELCDLVITVGPQKRRFNAHAAIIAARSPILRNLIRHAKIEQQNMFKQMVDDTHGSSDDPSANPFSRPNFVEIELPHTNAEAFQTALYFMYADRMPEAEYHPDMSFEALQSIIRLYELSLQMELQRLERLCERCILASVDRRNILAVLRLVSSASGLSALKSYCMSYVVQEAHFRSVINSPEFETLDQHLIVEIIRRQQDPNKREQPLRAVDSPAGSLATDMARLLADGDGLDCGDVTLLINGTRKMAHKAVLAARSQYFAGMFRSGMLEAETSVVKIMIGDVQPTTQAFESLLRYIYCGSVDMSPEDSMYLFSSPHFYGFTNDRLQVFCRHNLEENVSADNALQILEAADRIHALDMKRHAIDVIVHDFASVARRPKMRELKKSLLLDIMDQLADVVENCTCMLPATPLRPSEAPQSVRRAVSPPSHAIPAVHHVAPHPAGLSSSMARTILSAATSSTPPPSATGSAGIPSHASAQGLAGHRRGRE